MGSPGTLFQKGSWPPEAPWCRGRGLLDRNFSYCIREKKIISYTMTKKWCWLLMVSLLVASAPAAAAENPGEKKVKTISLAMVIPGIQQIKNKQYFKGSLFLAAFVGTAAAAFYYNKKGNDWYAKYLASTNVEEIVLSRKNTETNLKKRNLFLVGVFSVWLLHIIDLKFFKPGKSGVKSTVGKNEIDIGVYYTF